MTVKNGGRKSALEGSSPHYRGLTVFTRVMYMQFSDTVAMSARISGAAANQRQKF